MGKTSMKKKGKHECEWKLRYERLEMTMNEAVRDAKKAQEYYLVQVKKVNETLTKYNQKIDELDKKMSDAK